MEQGHICGRITITQNLWNSSCLGDWFIFQVAVDGKIKRLLSLGLLSNDFIGCPLSSMERNLRSEMETLFFFIVIFRMGDMCIPIHGNCLFRTFSPRKSAGGWREAFSFVADVKCDWGQLGGCGVLQVGGWHCEMVVLTWLVLRLGSPREFKKNTHSWAPNLEILHV